MTRPHRTLTVLAALIILFAQGLPGPLGVVAPARAVASPFADIADSPFRSDIEWLFAAGVTTGCTPTTYCPDDPVRRDQMASFLVRMFDLSPTTIDFFDDDAGNLHEANINSLAAAGITTGCSETGFCPSGLVGRDQMASFLVRAARLMTGDGRNYFRDDTGNLHEADIDRLAAAGIASGCGTWRYCPDQTIKREQMAGFLHRVATPLATPLPYPAPAVATLHVALTGADTANDCLAAATPCRTIRYALSLAIDGDTVSIGPGTYGEEDLHVGVDLSIHGDPAGTTTIDASGGGRARVMRVYPGATVRLEHLTFTGGRADSGGAIYNEGGLTIADSTISANAAADTGGGIWSSGSLTVTGTTIAENTAVDGAGISHSAALTIGDSVIRDNDAVDYFGGRGGGVFTDSGGTLAVSDSTISGNDASRGSEQGFPAGGGLFAWGKVTVIRSRIIANTTQGDGGGICHANGQALTVSDASIVGNSAGSSGGGIKAWGPVVITTSTIFDNRAGYRGGGLHHGPYEVKVSNSTISSNIARRGGGIAAEWGTLTATNVTISGNAASELGAGIEGSSGATVGLRNALVVGNTNGAGDVACADLYGSPDDCGGVSKVASIVGVPAGHTLADILDPAGLADNGGPTQTIALVEAADNPALGAGDGATCAATPVNGLDQRGPPRTPPCDIGAYELQP